MDPPKKRFNILSSGATKDQLKARIETLETISASLQVRVQEEKGRAQHQRNAHETTLKELREKNETYEGQRLHIHTLETALSRLEAENEALHAQTDDTAKVLQEQTAREEYLKSMLSASQNEVQRLTEEVEQLHAEAIKGEKRLEVQQQTTKRLCLEKEALGESLLELEQKVTWLHKQRSISNLGSFDDWVALGKEKANVELRLRNTEKLNESHKLGAKEMTELNNGLQETVAKLRKDLDILRQIRPANLRSLLHMRIIESAAMAKDDHASGPMWRPAISLNQPLDDELDVNKLQEYSQILQLQSHTYSFYQSLEIARCGLCAKPKFRPTSAPIPPIHSLAEFPTTSSYFSCCHELVCKQCVVERISHSVEHAWWFRLDTLQWLLCPREDCKSPLGIRCEADLEIFLGRNGCAYTHKVVSK